MASASCGSFRRHLRRQKYVPIPVGELDGALDGRVTFDGGSIDGFVRGEELDMVLKPDPATFAIYPGRRSGKTEARVICDIAMPDGSPFEGCPRTTLRRVIEDARDVLPACTSALEVEFYLFERGADARRPAPATAAPTSISPPTTRRRGAERDRRRAARDGPRDHEFATTSTARGSTRSTSRTPAPCVPPTIC